MTIWNDLRRRLGVAAGALIALSLPSAAADCARTEYDGQGYTVCTVSAAEEPRLGLWLYDDQGKALNGFGKLRSYLGRNLAFAMNAGMFHADYSPVGLFRSGDETHGKLVTAGGGEVETYQGGIFRQPTMIMCVPRMPGKCVPSSTTTPSIW